jgi:hypothetical protein
MKFCFTKMLFVVGDSKCAATELPSGPGLALKNEEAAPRFSKSIFLAEKGHCRLVICDSCAFFFETSRAVH